MTTLKQPFWKIKALHEMTGSEWESLCSGCGICCLHRFREGKSGKIRFTAVACRHLDLKTCRCRIYANRFRLERDCKKIYPENILKLTWLPKTCGYRTVAEGRDLSPWHPLISGNPASVHHAGISIKNREIISAADIVAGDVLKHLLIQPAWLSRGEL
ncbi:MAG: YcgN family cysteine cluster protein [Thermodesulfobacteriota bacterium]